MTAEPTGLKLSIVVGLSPDEALERVVTELERRLERGDGGVAMRLRPGADGGAVELRADESGSVREVEVGDVRRWDSDGFALAWRASDWNGDPATELVLRCEPVDGGTRIELEHVGWGASLRSGGPAEPVGWFADVALGPLMLAMAPSRHGEWLTDRRARRPTGPRAREVYRQPKEHQSGYDAALGALELTAQDVLLEVGCGGGAFMRQALETGCRAVAVDHSEEMVDLTRETNAPALREGRLQVERADAAAMPFESATFTAIAMTHVFFFLPEPQAALDECRRVLRDGGRLAIYTAAPELRGTPAAPEPIARQMHFYSDAELERMARAAGFSSVSVSRGDGAQLLVARV